jgi:CubicO group peptidase (beta-lactamase class C family)
MNELSQRVLETISEYQRAGAEYGIQVCAYHRGQVIVDVASGTRNLSGDVLDANTLVFGWSMTKGVTALAMHILVERGVIAYDDFVGRYWPEFAHGDKKYISIRQFLAHTSGMSEMPLVDDHEICDWDSMCTRFAAMTPTTHPGEIPAYHAISYGWLLGEVLRRADGRTLTQFVQDEICTPLGITNLHIGLPADRLNDCADLHYDGLPHPLRMKHVGSELMMRRPDMFANLPHVRTACMPGINMLTNARSLAAVYASLVGTGVHGVRLLTERRVDMVRSVQRLTFDGTTGFRMAMGLGYQLPDSVDDSAMSKRRGIFGHGGWGGSIAFADPEHEFAFALTKTNMNHNVDLLPINMVVAKAIRAHLGIPEE